MTECSVCFNDMDMQEYDDPNESTRTCIRLDCKHAFHTKCVMKCMKETNYECILCNKRRTPLEQKGLIIQSVNKATKDKTYRELRKVYHDISFQYGKDRTAFKKEVQAFIKQKSREYSLKEKRHAGVVAYSRVIRYARNYALKDPILSGIVIPKLDYSCEASNLLGLKPVWKLKRTFLYTKFI